MDIEIWSDIACPWCYVGKRRFEAALAAFEHRDEVTVTWRSFELDPQAPAERSVDSATHLADKYGMSRDEAHRRASASSPRSRPPTASTCASTSRAAATPSTPTGSCSWPRPHGVQDAMKERLMRAYFTEGEPIGDPDTLARLALEVGLPEDDVRDVLAGDPLRGRGARGRAHGDDARDQRRALLRRRPPDGRRGRPPARGARRAAAPGLGGAGGRMKQLAFITQGHADYDERLRALLDASGIDPEEFLGLEYFSLTPFFVLAGATVAAEAHAHGAEVHVSGVRVTVPEELEEAFLATLPELLEDAYAEEE